MAWDLFNTPWLHIAFGSAYRAEAALEFYKIPSLDITAAFDMGYRPAINVNWIVTLGLEIMSGGMI